MSPSKRPPPKKSRTAVPPRSGHRYDKGRPAVNRAPFSRPAGQPARGKQAAWQARRRRNLWIGAVSVVAVVAVVAVLIVVKVTASSSGGAPREPAPAAAVAKLTNIPLATLAQGTTKVSGLQPPGAISGPPLIAGGKPDILYIGAEFCPICATERWVMLVALSHFGTFTNLSQTHSAVRDGDIATISFYGSTYTSRYLTFTPVETTTNQPSGSYYKPLETPTASQMALWESFFPPNQEGFPFIDIAGKWVLKTSQFSPTVLEGKSFTDIVNSIGSNDTTIGAYVSASAAALTKAICSVTGQQPAATCAAVGGAASTPAASTPGASSPSH
jgi:hypothetical protein